MTGNRKWLFVLLGLTFLTGVSLGMWGERVLFSAATASPAKYSRSHKDWGARMLKKYTERLGLDDEQLAELGLILERRSTNFRELFSSIRPKMEELRESSRSEIRSLLRPDQIPGFEKLCQEQDERFRSWRRKPRAKEEGDNEK